MEVGTLHMEVEVAKVRNNKYIAGFPQRIFSREAIFFLLSKFQMVTAENSGNKKKKKKFASGKLVYNYGSPWPTK